MKSGSEQQQELKTHKIKRKRRKRLSIHLNFLFEKNKKPTKETKREQKPTN